MKRVGIIIGLLLAILITGSGCHNRKNDSSEMKDSGRMMRMGQNFRHNRGVPGMRGSMDQGMKSWRMEAGMSNGMMRGMGPGMGNGMMRGMHPGMGYAHMRGMGRMPMDSIGWMPMGPGRRMLESIPNVTENQKKLISDLVKKQHDDMKKIREEMVAKMQNLMESQRKDMLNILTDEQKKFIESGRGRTAPVPDIVK